MTNTIKAMYLRIDSTLVDKLKVLADSDGRSLNKEIEWILKQYLEQRSNSHE